MIIADLNYLEIAEVNVEGGFKFSNASANGGVAFLGVLGTGGTTSSQSTFSGVFTTRGTSSSSSGATVLVGGAIATSSASGTSFSSVI